MLKVALLLAFLVAFLVALLLAFLAAPQLGSPASSDGPAGCWIALRALEESSGRSDRHERLREAVAPPPARAEA